MSKKEVNTVNEPLEAYGHPLTFEKVWRLFKETDEKFKETDRKLDKVGKLLGNIGNNNADVAEAFFYNGLYRKKKLGRFRFDFVDRNRHRRHNRIESEYDILMFNNETVAVIEVKYKLHPIDVTYFVEQKLSKFRKLYPEYSHCKLFGGVASFDIPKDARKLAHDHGLFILEQDGKNICQTEEKGFAPKEY